MAVAPQINGHDLGATERPVGVFNADEAVTEAAPVTSERQTFGDALADRVTREIGSWRFIVVYFVLLGVWMAVNTVAWARHWDPYPFIFLNLVLSFQGAFAAPIILMSQNRQDERDRIAEHYDHAVNQLAEQEVALIRARIEEIGQTSLSALAALREEQRALHQRLDAVLARDERDPRTVTSRPWSIG
jgi:uncharacterized membrane protein